MDVGGASEHQSSSGLIVATGSGATGWAKSINQRRALALPAPVAPELAWFVREAWESPATGASLTAGLLAPDGVSRVTSEIDGVVFGDGIEDDRLEVGWGQRVEISAARERLRLVG